MIIHLNHINESSLELAKKSLPFDQPIFMVNMLRYHDQAIYETGSELPPCSGREAYFTRYVPAFRKLTIGQDIAPRWLGSVKALLVGAEGEDWDEIAIVRYPNFEAFYRIPLSADYRRDAQPHRLAALANLRLIATTEISVPA